MKKISTILIVFCLIGLNAKAQFIQQGNKLVGTNFIGMALEGYSVAISADGKTAIVGGPYDDSWTGAAWIYIDSAGTWIQQGGKLIGTGAIGAANQGFYVAISADGNTVIIGGSYDNNSAGAAWVFTRTAGVWSQQGNKLVGTGAVGAANQGYSVALSADGNTAIIGGANDDTLGAAWVFTRTAGVWTQQGNKLVGTGAVIVQNAYPQQGLAVSISADGNTAIVGGRKDNGAIGAVWIFVRSSGIWSQQGNKLVGTGYVGSLIEQGVSVALSGDGNTAIVGGIFDNGYYGASWIFTRSSNVWTQQGNKLVGTGGVLATYGINQGTGVSLSYLGDTAIVGGNSDNDTMGASWVFTRTAGVWTQFGNKLLANDVVHSACQGYSVSMSADGKTAIVGGFQDNENTGAAWIYSSNATGIKEINKGHESLSIFPNPATNLLTISLPANNIKSCTINLYDMLGQLIIENGELRMEKNAQQFSTLHSQLSINISTLPQGIYFLEVNLDGEKVVRKVVKM